MQHPYGYTYTDIILSALVLIMSIFIIVMFSNPMNKLKQENDIVRENGVRDLMQIMMEMSVVDNENFSKVVGKLAEGVVMIGQKECEYDAEYMCNGEKIMERCLDLSEVAVPRYISKIPQDPNKIFSQERTGYYMSFTDGVLEIGSCNPEAREKIILKTEF